MIDQIEKMASKEKLSFNTNAAKEEGPVGIEPTTCRSAVGCSTTELRAPLLLVLHVIMLLTLKIPDADDMSLGCMEKNNARISFNRFTQLVGYLDDSITTYDAK